MFVYIFSEFCGENAKCVCILGPVLGPKKAIWAQCKSPEITFFGHTQLLRPEMMYI